MQNDISFVFPNFQGERGGCHLVQNPNFGCKEFGTTLLKSFMKTFWLLSICSALRPPDSGWSRPDRRVRQHLLHLLLLLFLFSSSSSSSLSYDSTLLLFLFLPLFLLLTIITNILPSLPPLFLPSLWPLFWVLFLKSGWQIFVSTRPKPAYSRQGLDWIVRPGYSFRVFSKSRFAPPALSSVDGPNSDNFLWHTDKHTFS